MRRLREGSPGLRLPQAKLSRNSNEIARGRIPEFESHHPSHAVGSLGAIATAGETVEAHIEVEPVGDLVLRGFQRPVAAHNVLILKGEKAAAISSAMCRQSMHTK